MKANKLLYLIFLFLSISPAVKIYSQDGILDKRFGPRGIVTTPIGDNDEFGKACKAQLDGKIIVVGTSYNGTTREFAMVRYNTDLTLDTTFGSSGKVTTLVGTYHAGAEDVAIKSDGKIMVAGTAIANSYNGFALVRYNSNGTKDITFGPNGTIITNIGNGSAYGTSIAIQSDGKIIVAGYYDSDVGSSVNYDFAIARYHENGVLDNTFGTSGIATIAPSPTTDNCYDVQILSDGKIIAVGYLWNTTYNAYDIVVVKLNSDGSIDNTFGTNGITTTSNSIYQDHLTAFSVDIDSDGKILTGGYTGITPNFSIVIMRYLSNGSLDNSFGTNGKAITNIGDGWDEAQSIMVDADAKIVISGRSHNGSNSDFAVLRYHNNGTLDNSFGSNGVVLTKIGGGDDYGKSVLIQSDKKIFVCGASTFDADRVFAGARYDTDGSLDESVGFGKVYTDVNYDYGNAVAIQTDGKIIVAGYTYTTANVNEDFLVLRYNDNGDLDNSFGNNGISIKDIGYWSDKAYSVNIQSDNKIVVAGYTKNSYFDFSLARYNSDGTSDISFGFNGASSTPLGPGNDYAYSSVIQSDGKIILAGQTYNGSNVDFGLIRYNTDGTLDNSFGSSGIVTTDHGTNHNYGRSVNLQSDGKIILTGYSNNDIMLARYNTNGTLDSLFGTNGLVITDPGPYTATANTSIIQSDGKIIIAASYSGIDDFLLIRHNSDGTLDGTFGTSGIINITLGINPTFLAIQSDGKIIVAGQYNNGSDNDFGLARFLSTGTVDNTFGNNGITSTPFGREGDDGTSIAITPDGNLIFAGKAKYHRYNIALAKYIANTGTTFSNFISLKVFLEGPFNGVNNDMNDLLDIPLTSPYSEDIQTVSQIPNNVVDWVLVELRDKNESSIIIASKSAFVLDSGSVVDLDGVSDVTIYAPEDNYYIAIKHRNHLSVMSPNPVTFSSP